MKTFSAEKARAETEGHAVSVSDVIIFTLALYSLITLQINIHLDFVASRFLLLLCAALLLVLGAVLLVLGTAILCGRFTHPTLAVFQIEPRSGR